MSKKKAAGSSRNGRDSKSKRLGLKVSGGSSVKPGNIILKQKGLVFYPGRNVGVGRDYTIFSLKEGIVKFKNKLKKKYIEII